MFHEILRLDATILVARRTALEFASAIEVNRERVRVGLALDGLGRQGQALLVDSRQAPVSTDARMGDAFQKLREELARGFERTAVLVTTKIGVLQASRLTGDTRIEGKVAVFDSEAEALQFLRRKQT